MTNPIDDDLESIIYPGSPFSPTIEATSLFNIQLNIARKNPIVVAIAHETGVVGVKQNSKHQDDIDYLSYLGITEMDIIHYFYGFVTGPSLMFGAYIMNKFSVQRAIHLICPPTRDDTLIRHNQYKMNLLHAAERIYTSGRPDEPLNIAQPIYNLCKIRSFSGEKYFLAGVTASERVFAQFCQNLSH